jgi:hypothetical protein
MDLPDLNPELLIFPHHLTKCKAPVLPLDEPMMNIGSGGLAPLVLVNLSREIQAPANFAACTLWIGWVGLRVCLDAIEKRKFLHCRECKQGGRAQNWSFYRPPAPSVCL